MNSDQQPSSESKADTQRSFQKHPPVKKNKKSPSRLRTWVYRLVILLALWLIAVMVYQTHKPLPPGISYESPVYNVKNVSFLHDLTYPDGSATGKQESQILPRMLQIIEESRQFLVIDLFLFNDYTHKDQDFPAVSQEMTNKIIAQKEAYPNMDIVFITDEVNTNYNSAPNPLLEQMKNAGIHVILTDVNSLRDSTPAYSAVWRTFIQWFGQSGKGWIPNLMANDGPDITARSYLKLLNVKANHRKVILSEKTALISSGNVHDASAYNSNIALEVQGPILADILRTEQSAADMSDAGPLLSKEIRFVEQHEPNDSVAGGLQVRYLTEGKVYKYALQDIRAATQGDTLWLGMFYLAEDSIMDALVEASDRGVKVRLLLDPNQNAFGRDKIGIPNRPVAMDLNRRSDGKIEIRWYNTTKEQYHPKLLFISKKEGDSIILGGSSNFTARNLDDYNLENNLWVSMKSDQPLYTQMEDYFNRLWNNEDAVFSLPLEDYQGDITWLKNVVFRAQKLLGFTTF